MINDLTDILELERKNSEDILNHKLKHAAYVTKQETLNGCINIVSPLMSTITSTWLLRGVYDG